MLINFLLLSLQLLQLHPLVLLITISLTLLPFENPSKRSTYNNMIVLGKMFRSKALMIHPVKTSCEKNCDTIAIHSSLNPS